MSGDFRVPGADALAKWRQNSAYSDLGLSPESIAALDASEAEEQAIAERFRERTAANRALVDSGNALINQNQAEQLRTDALSDGELREELEHAIDSVNIAQRKVADAEQVLQLANQSVAEAQSWLAQHVDLDERISAFHVDRLKNGTPGQALPPDMVEARRQQREAADALVVAQGAAVVLARELEDARQAAEHLAQIRDQRAVAIISRYADGLAGDIEHAQQRLYELRGELLSITSLWLPLAGVSTSLPASDRVRAALRRQEERPLISEPIKAQARDWFTRLQLDPKAVIG